MKKFVLLSGVLLVLLMAGTKASAEGIGIPANLKAPSGNGMVVLSWDKVEGATSYNLYLSRHSGVNNSNYITKAGMSITNVTSPYKLTGLNNNITYYFVVTSKNISGESSPSNEVSATPQTTSNSAIFFKDISSITGLSQTKAPAFGNPLWGDINNDGNLDIIDTHHQRSISIYLNNGDGTFKDITENSGIINTLSKYDRHGIALGDYDNDGNLDLFIAMGGASGSGQGNSQLYKGDGTGHFIDVVSDSGLSIFDGRASAWMDFDNDGDLDLLVSFADGVEAGDGVVYKNNGNGFFEDVTDSTGLADAFQSVISFADYDNDGDVDFFSGMPGNDKLYRNNGNGTFSLNTAFPSSKNSCRGVAWGDYNNDGFIDLYVNRGQNDYHKALYWDGSRINFSFDAYPDPGEVTFKCESCSSITFNFQMSGKFPTTSYIFIGSRKENPSKTPFTLSTNEVTGKPEINAVNEDGFFVWRDEVNNIYHIQWTESSGTHAFVGGITSEGEFSQVETNVSPILLTNDKNTLYRNNGDGSFTDVTEDSGTGHIGNNSGVIWGDFDNDGLLDLYVVDAGDILGNRVNTLYHNIGNGIFEDMTSVSGVSAVDAPGRHYGVASGDFNNDGALDLLLSNGYGWGNPLSFGKTILLKNSGNENNWIKLILAGTRSNRSAIGSIVILNTFSGTQIRQLNGTGGELYSQGLSPIHFGLGNVSVIDSISIIWPNGILQTLNHIPANREITIVEGVNPPVVDLISPVEGVEFTVFSDITIEATASAIGGTAVSKVEFYSGSNKIGEDTAAPYRFIWRPSVAGSSTLTAKAISDDGSTMTSSRVDITVKKLIDDMICHLNFDEGDWTVAVDSSGSGNSGIINGAIWTTGKSGGGLSFDGVDDYVSVPLINNDEISISAWFYRNAIDTTYADAIFGGRRWNLDIQLNEGFELRFWKPTPHTLEFILITKDGNGIRTSKTATYRFSNSVGNWYHVVGTYKKTTGEQKLYVNGQLVNTQIHPAGNTIVPMTYYTDMRIGYSRVNNGYFNGIIDDISIYNRPLSDQEVQDLYSSN
ncbi:MAG: VCBS repeat-containing protein [Nitrospirae bacterium]|nr:VCBS repeat-containing protein [Nitrospirota bacterium]